MKFSLTWLFEWILELFRCSPKAEIVENNEVLPFENIPGPKRIPFIGFINEVLTLGSPKNLHKNIDSLHQKYGKIFRMNLGGTNTIFVSSDTYMKGIYRNEGKYPRHPVPPSWIYMNEQYNYKRGLFFMEGEEWLKYRKLLNPIFLRHFNGMQKDAIEVATDRLIASIEENSYVLPTDFQEIFNLETILYRWSVDVILQLMLGYDFDINNAIPHDVVTKFACSVHEIFKYSADIHALSPIWAQKLMPKKWQLFEQAVHRNLDLGNKIVDKVIEAKPSGGLYVLFEELGLTEYEIKRIFTDLIIAAGDTTASASQWALYLMATNPDQQENIRGLSFEAEDVVNIVKETLRLYPTAFVIGRFIERDSVLGNYQVPKNTLALMSLYTSGRSNENFSNANQFIPSRWAKTETKSAGETFCPHASTPFASGMRDCIGRKIAMSAMQMLISKMTNTFEMKLLNEKEVDVMAKMVLVPKDPIRLGLRKL